MVFRSFIRSLGPMPSAAAAMDGSTKYRVSDVRMADFERRFGFHAGMSSTTKIRFSAATYEATVSGLMADSSLAAMSDAIAVFAICCP